MQGRLELLVSDVGSAASR